MHFWGPEGILLLSAKAVVKHAKVLDLWLAQEHFCQSQKINMEFCAGEQSIIIVVKPLKNDLFVISFPGLKL